MSLAAYAPEQTAPKQAEAAAQSAIEEQLALQHKQPAQLSQLERKGSNLLIDGDTILLEGLAPTTAVKRHDAGGVVLGFEIANGAVASYDFPVGKVLYISCHMTGSSWCNTKHTPFIIVLGAKFSNFKAMQCSAMHVHIRTGMS